MFTVGLTGGIASGKSTVGKFFIELGITLSDADLAARKVVKPGTPALEEIAKYFGRRVIRDDGSLDRALLRSRVFDDTKQKEWLEQLLHPLIKEVIEQELAKSTGSYAILSSPLLFETTQHQLTHRNLVVDIPEEEQVRRACERDNNEESQIRAIMATQLSREERLDRADDVINNSGSTDDTRAQVLALHEQYQKLSGAE